MLILLLFLFNFVQSAVADIPSQMIRVRLQEVPSQQGFNEGVGGVGMTVSAWTAQGEGVQWRSQGASEWKVVCGPQGILAIPQGSSPGAKQALGFEASFRVSQGVLTLGSRAYRGELRIHEKGGHCEIVNHLPLENYLEGLVNTEFSSKWKEEAIAAQVVAARSYAYSQMSQARRHPSSYYDVENTVHDQVYEGALKEDLKATEMVRRTQGLVLVIPLKGKRGGEDKPIKAFYHSTCGGQTEIPEHVWGPAYRGFLKSVKCPFCVNSPKFKWEYSLSEKNLTEILLQEVEKSRRKDPQLKLLQLKSLQTNTTGRVAELLILWDSAKGPFTQVLKGSAFRNAIGPTRLRSTSFTADVFGETPVRQWRFKGVGNGHGVGMCQWGAKIMGDRGFKMDQILKFYYPEAVLKKMP